MSHPNIVPFIGVSMLLFPLCMVSEWMPQSNVRKYVKCNSQVNRLKLVRGTSISLD